MNKIQICLILLLVFSPTFMAQTNVGEKTAGIEKYFQKIGLINIQTLDPSIRIDIKYATTDNFTKAILYDSISHIYLHPLAATKLIEAQKYLKQLNPTLSLLVYDGVRPLNIQRKMYKVVQGTRYAAYVANPQRTGLHNYGMAVDLTICDSAGNILDMGTPFDYFGAAAGTNKESLLLQQGVLSKLQISNRQLLRKVMLHAGFLTIRGEWWHFNAVSLNEAKRSYKLIE